MTKETTSSFLPPQAVEVEKALLGVLLIDNSSIWKVADILSPEDFYKLEHQLVYKAILELFEKGNEADVLTVSARLEEKGELDKAGGNSYLAELVESASRAGQIQEYARLIREKKVLRDLIHASFEIGELASREDREVEEILDEAESKIFAIAQRSLVKDFVPLKETLEEAFERIEKLSRQEAGLRGVPTGFKELDNLLAGFQKSDLIILASRPSMGKSSLALSFALNAAMYHKVPVGIFSLEMSRDQIVDRLIANLSGVNLWKIRTGRLSGEGPDNDFERIQRALGILAETPIFIDDTALMDILRIRAMARRLQAKEGLGLLIIDYLQLIEPRNPQDSVVRQISEISRSLKILARELSIPVLALAQLSRAVERRSPSIPKLADLRDSGSLEQDADVVMFIYREEHYRPDTPRKGIADIMVAKHRNGPVGKVELYFDEGTASFRSIERDLEEIAF